MIRARPGCPLPFLLCPLPARPFPRPYLPAFLAEPDHTRTRALLCPPSAAPPTSTTRCLRSASSVAWPRAIGSSRTAWATRTAGCSSCSRTLVTAPCAANTQAPTLRRWLYQRRRSRWLPPSRHDFAYPGLTAAAWRHRRGQRRSRRRRCSAATRSAPTALPMAAAPPSDLRHLAREREQAPLCSLRLKQRTIHRQFI